MAKIQNTLNVCQQISYPQYGKSSHSHIFYTSSFRNATVWSRLNNIQVMNDPLPYIDL